MKKVMMGFTMIFNGDCSNANSYEHFSFTENSENLNFKYPEMLI
jgi:hypothetical protein